MDMPAASATTRAVNLRVRDDVRELIDSAARSESKTRSEFMIDAARRAAEETLLDRTLVRVDAAVHAAFLDVLDRPPGGEGYSRLMAAPRPWQD
jgi:uncharacterized protein (DUF1778 family)